MGSREGEIWGLMKKECGRWCMWEADRCEKMHWGTATIMT